LHARPVKNGPSGFYFGDPKKRWIDGIKKEVGRSWYRIAQGWQKWRRHGEVYVQKRMGEH